jgi:hypothetical protein
MSRAEGPYHNPIKSNKNKINIKINKKQYIKIKNKKIQKK